MLLVRNMSLTPGGSIVGTTGLAANYPTNPIPMGGSSLLIAFVNITGVAATSIAASGWTSAGAAITQSTTVQQAFTKSAANDTGTITFTWIGTSTHVEIFIFEVYSTQGSVPTLGTYAYNAGSATSATWPSPTLTQASELILACLFLDTNTNILNPDSPVSFTGGWSKGAGVLYGNINSSNNSLVGMLGCRSTTLPSPMPTASWSGTHNFIVTALPILEATAGDPIFTGVGLSDNTVGGSANSLSQPLVPGTAQTGDVLFAVVAQGQLSGSQATGQTVGQSDIAAIVNSNFQSGTPFNVTVPSQAKTGDLMLALMGTFSAAVNSYTAPSGWTAIANTAGTSGHTTQGLFYHIVTSGDVPGTTTYSFSLASSDNSNVFVATYRSISGATFSIDQTSATTVAVSGTGNFTTVTTTVANELVFYVISQTTAAPGLGAGITALYTGTGTVVGYAPQATAATTPTVTYTSGRTDGIITTFSIKSSTPSPWTHIRQDNEPNSTYSQDLFWCAPTTVPGGVSALFTVPTAVMNLQAKIISFGNVDTGTPIDDNQGASGVGNTSQWATPPSIGATSNSGVLLYIWGCNLRFGGTGSYRLQVNSGLTASFGSSAASGSGPATAIYDVFPDTGDGSNPSHSFQVGYGSPDMADYPQYATTDNSSPSKGWAGQTLAIKASSAPVRTTNQLQVQLASLIVMGSALIVNRSVRRTPRDHIAVDLAIRPKPYKAPRRFMAAAAAATVQALIRRFREYRAVDIYIPHPRKRKRPFRRIFFLSGNLTVTGHPAISGTGVFGSGGTISISGGNKPTMTGTGVVVINPVHNVSGVLSTTPFFTGSALNLSIFPTLPGMGWPVKKSPEWHNLSSRTAATFTYRATDWTYPIWHFDIPFNFLRAMATPAELETLFGLFGGNLGPDGQFLFDDPSDDTVYPATPATIGTGTGVITQFQLTRPFYTSGGTQIGTEPIIAPQPGAILYLNGVAQSASTYTIGATGLVTFATPPGNGVTVAWSGKFWYVCRFEDDGLPFETIYQKMWKLGALKFQSVKQ